jgi:hypothetical protein
LLVLLVACGPQPRPQTSQCFESPLIHKFSPPVATAATVSSVKNIVANWPDGDAGWSPEADRQKLEVKRQILGFGRENAQAALIDLLVEADPTAPVFGDALAAYDYLNLSIEPIQHMVLAANLSERRKNSLYRLLVFMEDPPLALSHDRAHLDRRLSAERRTYVCLAAERVLQESLDSAMRDSTRGQAGWLIGLLRDEARWGIPDAATYLQDPLIRRVTTVLVQDGYVAPE